MRLPPKNSRAELILSALRAGPATLEQGVERHTDFGIARVKVRACYQSLIESGCAVLQGEVYALSDAAHQWFEGCPPVPLSLLPPAAASVSPYRPAPRPLEGRRQRLMEPRPGAFSYRDVPSMMSGERVGYKSSIATSGTDDAHV